MIYMLMIWSEWDAGKSSPYGLGVWMLLMRGSFQNSSPLKRRFQSEHAWIGLESSLSPPCTDGQSQDPRRSVSQLLRDPEMTLAEVAGFQWNRLFIAPASLFHVGEEALRWHVVSLVLNKTVLNWIHLRWTKQGFLIIPYLFSQPCSSCIC